MLQKLTTVMVAIARWMMPRGRIDLMVKVTVMTIFIHFFSVTAERFLLGQVAYPFWPRLLLTASSALPFVAMVVVSFSVAEKSRAKLRTLAETDTLTSLPNRRAFMSALDAALTAGARGYLLILDGDSFKSINDTLGHATGDRALLAIAARLHRLATPQVSVARLGGDEFGVLVLDADADSYLSRIERILCAGVRFNLSDSGQDVIVRMSAGAARLAPDRAVIRLMAEADRALYDAKALGGGRLLRRDQRGPTRPPPGVFPDTGTLQHRSAPMN